MTNWKEITAEEFHQNPKKDPEKEALYAEVKKLKNENESLRKDLHHKDQEIGRLMQKIK
jgi:cell shape-determining protein MreC